MKSNPAITCIDPTDHDGDYACIAQHVGDIMHYLEQADYDSAMAEASYIYDDVPTKYKP